MGKRFNAAHCATLPPRGRPALPKNRHATLDRKLPKFENAMQENFRTLHSLRLRARHPLLVGLLSQIIEPRSCINNDISYTFALSRGRSVRPRLHPHLLPYCQVGFCRRGPSCLPLFNAFVPCHWLSNGNQVDLKCDCNFFPLVGWVGWYLFLVKAPSAAVMPPQRPAMLLCVGAWVESKRYFRSIAIVVNFIKSLCGERLLDDRSVWLYVLYSITASLFLVVS